MFVILIFEHVPNFGKTQCAVEHICAGLKYILKSESILPLLFFHVHMPSPHKRARERNVGAPTPLAKLSPPLGKFGSLGKFIPAYSYVRYILMTPPKDFQHLPKKFPASTPPRYSTRTSVELAHPRFYPTTLDRKIWLRFCAITVFFPTVHSHILDASPPITNPPSPLTLYEIPFVNDQHNAL